MDIRSGTIGQWAGEDSPLLKRKRPKRKAEGLDGVKIDREESRHADTRQRDRLPVHGQPCRITYRGGEHDAEIVNLSGGGAMIAAALKPNVAERVDLHLGEDGHVECIVRWAKPGRMGLEFAHETQLECSDEERAALLWDALDRAFPASKPLPASPSSEEPSDQRIAKRHPLIWSAELHARTGSWHVRLRNISATGALIQCSKPLPVGREVVLDLGKGGSVDATVSWAVGDHAGVKFDEPFDMQRLSHARPSVAPARWLRPAYLENEVPEDSTWDASWSRMSVEELKAELEGFLKR
jgi:PilZ domain